MSLLGTLTAWIEDRPGTVHCEDDLQRHLAHAVMGWHEGSWFREYQLSDRFRLDLYHPATGIAIEAKVGGSRGAVLRQLSFYASHPDVSGIVLATTRASHNRMPPSLGRKPIMVARLWLWAFR